MRRKKTIFTKKESSDLYNVKFDTIEDKVKALNDLGVKITVVERNSKLKKGYVLGKMRDDHPKIKIVG